MNILYILMRNDLPSMNAGKAMAQASHASNSLIKEFGQRRDVLDWSRETEQGFGTVLVLAVNKQQLVTAVGDARFSDYAASIVEDPTYPYRTNAEIAALIPDNVDTAPRTQSGEQVTLYRNEMTCGYIFGDKEMVADFVKDFPLHP